LSITTNIASKFNRMNEIARRWGLGTEIKRIDDTLATAEESITTLGSAVSMLDGRLDTAELKVSTLETTVGRLDDLVFGAHTVTTDDVTATKVSISVVGKTVTGILAEMVSPSNAPVALTEKRFTNDAESGDATLEFTTTTLAEGQIINYILF